MPRKGNRAQYPSSGHSTWSSESITVALVIFCFIMIFEIQMLFIYLIHSHTLKFFPFLQLFGDPAWRKPVLPVSHVVSEIQQRGCIFVIFESQVALLGRNSL